MHGTFIADLLGFADLLGPEEYWNMVVIDSVY